jgi:hypothetical protein
MSQPLPTLISDLIARLRAAGMIFDPGLTDAELERIETRCAFVFPPDLREFYQQGLPLIREIHGHEVKDFPNWRKTPVTTYRESQQRLLRDLTAMAVADWSADQARAHWPTHLFGAMPASARQRKAVITGVVGAAPTLLPLYGHRYLPVVPERAGNPVFSIMDSADIIYYGFDLFDYFAREFGIEPIAPPPPAPRPIPFWTELHAWANRRSDAE